MFIFESIYKKILADIFTPLDIYLKLRDKFTNVLLFESSDYHTTKNKLSIICLDIVSEIIIDDNYINYLYPNGKEEKIFIPKMTRVQNILETFLKKFIPKGKLLPYSGFYGYFSYDSITYFENIFLKSKIFPETKVPKIRLDFFKNLIILDHFYKKVLIIYHSFLGNKDNFSIKNIIDIIYNKKRIFFSFKKIGNTFSHLTDDSYKKMVEQGIEACVQGNVFQIVLSRQYYQSFKGDDFNVYRALRAINPSPYLFYFNYENYRIFGSSPESHLIIKKNMAYIKPIAGTLPRTGNEEKDKLLANYLKKDEKENVEHVMLVDLARNDLSRNCLNVKVEKYKYIKYFSHVLHMISKISGIINKNNSNIKIFTESFPAGTLSGAPKYKAMELIDNLENRSRSIYGGVLGFWGLDGQITTAIIIRSCLSKKNNLFFQAGAGIVSLSQEEKELQEVENKLSALYKAIISASYINKNEM